VRCGEGAGVPSSELAAGPLAHDLALLCPVGLQRRDHGRRHVDRPTAARHGWTSDERPCGVRRRSGVTSGVSWRPRGSDAAACAELQRLRRAVRPVGERGMPEPHRSARRTAPTEDTSRIRHALPSRAESPRTREQADRTSCRQRPTGVTHELSAIRGECSEPRRHRDSTRVRTPLRTWGEGGRRTKFGAAFHNCMRSRVCEAGTHEVWSGPRTTHRANVVARL
jgi:hypothetical protein